MMHPQLEAAFLEDRQDHRSGFQAGSEAHMAMRERDRQRRQGVSELLEAGVLHTAEELHAAAQIFQHGEDLADFEQAHFLALKAAELGDPRARWLAAASLDRLLVHQRKLQKYGTQYVSDGKRQRLLDVDPETTDKERARWDVPPLAEQHWKAEEATRNFPPMPLPPNLPEWYRLALDRWAAQEGS